MASKNYTICYQEVFTISYSLPFLFPERRGANPFHQKELQTPKIQEEPKFSTMPNYLFTPTISGFRHGIAHYSRSPPLSLS